MSEASIKLAELQQRVVGRKQVLALQDRVAIVILIGGLLTAGFVVMERLLFLRPAYWIIFAFVMAALVAALAFDWYRTRATKKEAAFLIDQTFALEDRVSTAHNIIARGGAERDVEVALLEDAASRVADKNAATIVPYRVRSWHAIGLVGIAALVAAFMIPERALPGGQALIEARADIQTAGEQLEDVGEKIARIAPSESITANLAKEQAELGRSLRRMPLSRAEALQKLSALEDRIRQRHSELADTRADEIVSLAQKRIGAALQPKSNASQKKEVAADEQGDELSAEPDAQNEAADAATTSRKSPPRGKTQSAVKPSGKQMAKSVDAGRINANRTASGDPVATARPQAEATRRADQPTDSSKANPNPTQAAANGEAQNQSAKPNAQPSKAEPASAQATNAGASNQPQSPQSPDASDRQAQAKNDGNSNAPSADSKNPQATDANKQADGQPSGDQNQSNDAKPPDASKDSTDPLTGMMADQAAKMLPKMSSELLKKAAELRAGKLTAEDLKGLQQSAEMLARDLSKIAQSKELQQAAEQLAKQITPEMIEQFARSLGNLEQLKQELQASAQLLMQNQEAKSMVAGLAQKFAKIGEEFDKGRSPQRRNRQPANDENNPQANEPQRINQRAGRGNGQPDDAQGRAVVRASGGLTARAGEPLQRTGKGVDTKLNGKVTRGAGGDYLFLKAQAGGGMARAPYSSAYPRYRREAERTVERSQVPPHLRSVVRGYFDAINPDGTRKP
jgi:hypothetical protein